MSVSDHKLLKRLNLVIVWVSIRLWNGTENLPLQWCICNYNNTTTDVLMGKF